MPIAYLPPNTPFNNILSCQDALPSIGWTTPHRGLHQVTVRKYFALKTRYINKSPPICNYQPCLASSVKLNCFCCLKPITLWALGAHSFPQLIHAIFLSSFRCPPSKVPYEACHLITKGIKDFEATHGVCGNCLGYYFY